METSIPRQSFQAIDKGAKIAKPLPGDFILVRGNNFFDKLIKFGQGLRYGFKNIDRLYTHVAIIEDEAFVIEATSKGIVRTPLEKYTDYQYVYVSVAASEEDRLEMLRFAKSCMRESYGWVTLVSVAFSMLTGMKFSVGLDGQEICSGLVARALERGTFIPPRDASHLAPIDLAQLFIK